ncbi:hypothetical protein EJV47_08660 [Hymenobacter gummosus]|uniref:Uncharacterized protein n=1 Tax=Hymenobacter gummosus TaxID=1776032 RepID=A0A3S0HP81_9BACT|nr:hypothetical protein [Hymenobacter gummosus]RTQ50694.1 hypothetical protein EJV47_08660 [Hymenobacter gummosus]
MLLDLLADTRPITKAVLLTAGGLLLYSLLCRWWNIYFFWESRAVGWTLLQLGAILYVLNSIDARSARRKNGLPEKIIVGVLCFGLLLRLLVWTLFAQSDAYAAARRALLTSPTLHQQIGPVRDVSIRPLGHVNRHESDRGTQGDAQLHVTAKGQRGYQDLRVALHKDVTDSTWVLRSVSVH